MDLAMLALAEKLAAEFPEQPNSTVIRILTDCVEEFPRADPEFLEEASRTRLAGPEAEPSANLH